VVADIGDGEGTVFRGGEQLANPFLDLSEASAHRRDNTYASLGSAPRRLGRFRVLDQTGMTFEVEDSALQHRDSLSFVALVTSKLANLADQLATLRLDHAPQLRNHAAVDGRRGRYPRERRERVSRRGPIG